jgi:hypothetical protein
VHGAWAGEAIRIVVTATTWFTMTQKRLRQSSIYRWAEIFMGHNLGFLSEGHLSHLGSLVLPQLFFLAMVSGKYVLFFLPW